MVRRSYKFREIITLDNNLEITDFESTLNETLYSLVRLRYPCAYDISINKAYNETDYIVGPSSWLAVSVTI